MRWLRTLKGRRRQASEVASIGGGGNICRGDGVGRGADTGGGGVGWCLVEQLGRHTTRRGATPTVGRSCPARVRRDDTEQF